MKKQPNSRATTLLELTISLIVLSVLVIVFAAIDLFSQAQVLTVDRRARVQNEATYVLEHSVKQIARAIGNTRIDYSSSAGDGGEIIKTTGSEIEFYVDANFDGGRDTDGSDYWRAYSFHADPTFQVWYCPQCSNSSCGSCLPDWSILSKKITAADYTYDPAGGYVDISVTACWDPDQSRTGVACGASDKNPQATMSTRVRLPSVSTG